MTQEAGFFFYSIKETFGSVKGFLNYLERLLGEPLFPRTIMTAKTNGQVKAKSKEEFLELLKEANFENCYISSHSETAKNNHMLQTVFLDFDNEKNIAEALKDANIVAQKIKEELNVETHIHFSGAKGCHIVLPVRPMFFETEQKEKKFLAYVQTHFSMPTLDKQIIGDISRLVRVPFTINTKARETPWKGHVKVLQLWNGNLADLSLLYEQYKLFEEIQKVGIERRPRAIFLKKGRIRKEVLELIDRAERGIHLTHNQRLAVAAELLSNGWDKEGVINVFRKQEDFSYEKTRYQVEWLIEHGYKPYTKQKLEEVLKEVESN